MKVDIWEQQEILSEVCFYGKKQRKRYFSNCLFHCKDKDEKFIPIGHSIGSWFALHFSNLYPSRCLKVVFLEGAYIDSNNNDFKRIKNNKVKSKDINNKNIDLLVNSLLKIKKIDRFTFNKQTLKDVNKLFAHTFCKI